MKKIAIRPTHIFFFLLFLLLVSYSLFQARFVILGPQITIESHEDGQTVENSTIILEGSTENIARLSLNGRQIFTDETGWWSEKLIVREGLSIMTVEARDRFGRETRKSVRIVLLN